MLVEDYLCLNQGYWLLGCWFVMLEFLDQLFSRHSSAQYASPKRRVLQETSRIRVALRWHTKAGTIAMETRHKPRIEPAFKNIATRVPDLLLEFRHIVTGWCFPPLSTCWEIIGFRHLIKERLIGVSGITFNLMEGCFNLFFLISQSNRFPLFIFIT